MIGYVVHVNLQGCQVGDTTMSNKEHEKKLTPKREYEREKG